MQQTVLNLHIWPVAALTLLVGVNLAVVLMQRDDRALEKYLRIQAIAWITLMSMIVFTGASIMAYLHLDFTVKIWLMIAAAVALSFLELRRHLALKRAKAGSDCFAAARRLFTRYYLFEMLWLLMVGGLAPAIS